jgi:hypothetical protein
MSELNEAKERRRPATVVTSQNLSSYQAMELDRLAPTAIQVEPMKVEKKDEPEKKEEKAEAVAKEQDKVEAKDEPKKEEIKADVEIDKKDAEIKESDDEKKSKNKLSERMHELTEKAKTEKAKREEIERELAEVKAKLKPEPVKISESPKPTREQFPDPHEYAEKLSDWSVQDALRKRDEQDAAARQEAAAALVQDNWQRRVEDIKKEVPDFAEKIAESKVVVTNEVRDMILDSEIGPRILLHFVEHPDEADKIGKMTIGRAYVALGRLEAKLSEPKAEAKPKEEEVKKVVKPVEISKAPPPITPLKGASSPPDLPMVDGVWKGTHEQYKEARRSGKIK